jgi:hypothetical protein
MINVCVFNYRLSTNNNHPVQLPNCLSLPQPFPIPIPIPTSSSSYALPTLHTIYIICPVLFDTMFFVVVIVVIVIMSEAMEVEIQKSEKRSKKMQKRRSKLIHPKKKQDNQTEKVAVENESRCATVRKKIRSCRSARLLKNAFKK